MTVFHNYMTLTVYPNPTFKSVFFSPIGDRNHFGIKETFDGNLLLNIFLSVLSFKLSSVNASRFNEFITLCNVAKLRETGYSYRSDIFSIEEQWF